jgi:hypothetical protein
MVFVFTIKRSKTKLLIRRAVMTSTEVFNPGFMKDLKSIMDESLSSAKKVDVVPMFNNSVSIDKFVSQCELNFMSFLYSCFFQESSTSSPPSISELKKHQKNLYELTQILEATNVYEEDKTIQNMTYTFLKSCIVNNVFATVFGFEYPFLDQENVATKVKMNFMDKLKKLVEVLFESKVVHANMVCLRHAVFYEVTRLRDIYIDKKRDNINCTDEKYLSNFLLDEPEDGTLDCARTKYAEYLLTSTLIAITETPVVCPNVFHLMIRRAPSGHLYFKTNPCVLNEFILYSTNAGVTVAVSMMNLMFLCVYKHRVNLLKTLLKADYKQSKRLKTKTAYDVSAKYTMRFDSYGVELEIEEVKKEICGNQEMTLLHFAMRVGYTPSMISVLVEKIVDAYRDLRHFYDADEIIKTRLAGMIKQNVAHVFLELFSTTVMTFPFVLKETDENAARIFRDLVPDETHFETIFLLKHLRCSSQTFLPFTIHDIMAFASFSDIGSDVAEDSVNKETCASYSPFFLPLVYVKLIYNVALYTYKNDKKFVAGLCDFYLPALFEVMNNHIGRLVDDGYDSTDFLFCCQMMTKIIDIQSAKGKLNEKLMDSFMEFFDFWIMKDEMAKFDLKMEQNREKEVRMQKNEIQNMEEEDYFSRKYHQLIIQQERRRLEQMRKESELKEKQKKLEESVELARQQKLQKQNKLETETLFVQSVLEIDDVFTSAEQKLFCNKIGKTDVNEIIAEIKKKREMKHEKKKMEEEKLLLKKREKEELEILKVCLETNLLPSFESAVRNYELEDNVHVKNIRQRMSKTTCRLVEKKDLLENFLTVLLPQLSVAKVDLKKQEEEAAADAKKAAAETIDAISNFDKGLLDSYLFKELPSDGFENIVLSKEDYVSFFESFMKTSWAKMKLIFLDILSAPSVVSHAKTLITFFNVFKYKSREGETAQNNLLDFMSRVLVVLSFLSQHIHDNSGFDFVLKGSNALNYYVPVDCLDLDFCFSTTKKSFNSCHFFERVSATICWFLKDLFTTFYSSRCHFDIDHGSFVDNNGFKCTLKFGLNFIADRINCTFLDKVTKQRSSLPLIDFNFGSVFSTRFRESKNSLVFNLETKMLKKTDKASRERNAGKANLLFGTIFLPTIEALLEERVYFLVFYSEIKTSRMEEIDFVNLSSIVASTRDPKLFYINKTMTQLSNLLRTYTDPRETLRKIYIDVQTQEKDFPDFEDIIVFRYLNF